MTSSTDNGFSFQKITKESCSSIGDKISDINDINDLDDIDTYDDLYDDLYDESCDDINKNTNLYEEYNFYDEMNDLDSCYKQIHHPSNQDEICWFLFTAIMRPIFLLLLCMFIIAMVDRIITNENGMKQFEIFANLFSSSHWLHYNVDDDYNKNFHHYSTLS